MIDMTQHKHNRDRLYRICERLSNLCAIVHDEESFGQLLYEIAGGITNYENTMPMDDIIPSLVG